MAMRSERRARRRKRPVCALLNIALCVAFSASEQYCTVSHCESVYDRHRIVPTAFERGVLNGQVKPGEESTFGCWVHSSAILTYSLPETPA
jgi:hypothetical protein